MMSNYYGVDLVHNSKIITKNHGDIQIGYAF